MPICPKCGSQTITLSLTSDVGKCNKCHTDITLTTDMISAILSGVENKTPAELMMGIDTILKNIADVRVTPPKSTIPFTTGFPSDHDESFDSGYRKGYSDGARLMKLQLKKHFDKLRGQSGT